MPLDTSIPLQVRQAQTESPINQMAKLYEMKQAQQANALNELKMQEYQRGLAEQESIKNKLSLAKSPEDVANVLLAHGKAKEASDYLKSAQETKNLGLTGLETEAKTRETALRTVEKRLNILGQGFGAVRNNPTPETALRVLKYVADNGAITPEQYDRYVADINANPDPARIKAMADEGFMTALSAKEQLPTFQMQSTGGATRVLGINPVTGQATVAPGSEAKLTATPGELLSAQTTRRGQDLANARELQRIEIEQQKSSPSYLKPLTAIQESKLRNDMGKNQATAQRTIDTMDEVLSAVSDVRNANLNKITGLTSYAPALTKQGRTAETKLANLKGKVTALGKAAASLSGAIGPMAVQEWKIVQDQIASLDVANMNEKDLSDQLDIIAASAKAAQERVKAQYEDTHAEDFARYPGRFQLSPSKNEPKAPSIAPAKTSTAPKGVDQKVWDHMTPEEQKLFN